MEQKIIIIKILHQINVFAIVFCFFDFQVLITGTLCNIFFNVKVPECQFRSAGVVLKCFRGM